MLNSQKDIPSLFKCRQLLTKSFSGCEVDLVRENFVVHLIPKLLCTSVLSFTYAFLLLLFKLSG